MKMHLNKLAAAAFSLALAVAAHAAGTASGTSISNTATVNYTVGGVAQPAVASTSASFLVDSKVSLTVAPTAGVGTSTFVVAGATSQVKAFTVTNTGNLTSDFALSVAQLASGTTYGSPTSYTDNFDVTGCQVFADANGNGTYESGTDTLAFVDELAPDAARVVFAVCNVPAGRANGDMSAISLTATASDAGSTGALGATTVASVGAKALNTVAVVFADPAGTDDASNDGKVSARGGFLVQTASLTASKTVTAYCDPVTFNATPKLVPGAYARYQITMSNAGTAAASAALGSVGDTLVAQLGFDPNLINATAASCSTPTSAAGSGLRITCTGGSRACTSTPVYLNTATYVSGQVVNVNMVTALPAEGSYAAGELKPGESVTLTFNAIVQ